MNKLLVFVAFLAFSNCDSLKKDKSDIRNEGGKLVERIFYPNGELKEIHHLNFDTLREGISYLFYKNGDTASIVRYYKGFKDSIETKIYPSGFLESLSSWRKGRLFGESISYYDSLKDIYFTERDNDTVKVEEPLKKSYLVYGLDEQVIYSRKFDKSSKLIAENGKTVLLTKLEGNEIYMFDTLAIQYYLASPDWVTREFFINIYNSDGALISSKPQIIDEKHDAVFFETIFKNSGVYKIEAISKFSDDLFENIKLDTVNLELKVKGDQST